MAKKKKYDAGLPGETIVQMVATKGEEVWVKEKITLEEFKKVKRVPGWYYRAFQLGYSSFKDTKKK